MLGSLSRIIDKERALGIEEGMTQGMMEIINKMLEKGIKIEEIKEITGLTNKEIEEMQRKIKK